MIDGQEIDPASIRYRIAGREYRIGTRVLTPGGMGIVTAFDPGDEYDIGVVLDGQTEIDWTTWEYAELQTAERAQEGPSAPICGAGTQE